MILNIRSDIVNNKGFTFPKEEKWDIITGIKNKKNNNIFLVLVIIKYLPHLIILIVLQEKKEFLNLNINMSNFFSINIYIYLINFY